MKQYSATVMDHFLNPCNVGELPDAGQVYLVEKEPSVSGIMAQLNKTYPPMDCPI